MTRKTWGRPLTELLTETQRRILTEAAKVAAESAQLTPSDYVFRDGDSESQVFSVESEGDEGP